MKTGVFIQTTILLIEAISPSLAAAATELPGAQQTDPVVERAIQRLHSKAVTVLRGKELDLKALSPGLYAYLVFNTNEVENAAMGRIVNCDSNRVVIAAGKGTGWEIARQDIVAIAVADNPGGIELWRMSRREMLQVQETAMTVLSGESLDPVKLKIGWHVHVDYRSNGVRRSTTGVIIRRDANRIVIRPGKKSGVRWTIRSDDVARIIVARKRRDMDRWQRARQAMRELQGPRVRMKASSTSPEWVTGRLIRSGQDTLEILSERGAERIPRALVKDLEVSMGRHRNTIKGMGIGLVSGLGAAFLIYPHDIINNDRRGKVGEREDADRVFYAVLAVPLATVCGTLVGVRSITEKWVEVSPSRINLNVSPTRNNGLRAAISFEF